MADKAEAAVASTIAKVVGKEAKDWGKNFVQHIIFEQILGVRGAGESTDYEHKKDRQNETAVGAFRVLFAQKYQNCAPILDRVFRVLKSDDYLAFSLFILENVANTAYSSIKGESVKEENFADQDAPLIRKSFTIITSDAKEKGGEKSGGKKTEIKQEFSPNLHYAENYQQVIDLVGKTIMSVRQPDSAEWVKATLERFAENGWIAQGMLATVARYFDLDTLKQWRDKAGRSLFGFAEITLTIVDATAPRVSRARQWAATFRTNAINEWRNG